MSLKRYRTKRRFGKTPEPKARKQSTSGPLQFVVQKHDASRLHYDFRLELDGVLKSWAIPKGPSLDPNEKRLAVMTEDHPLDYQHFEGVIPEGNYGAGTVMVWDKGVYCSRESADRGESERHLRLGIEKGDLKIILDGQKLRGEFALVKMKKADDNAWLLIKKRDEFATRQDITQLDRSVLTNRTIHDIALAAATGVDSRQPRDALDLSDAPAAKMPDDIRPMLAVMADKPFNRSGWLFEVKWDGYRAIAEIEGGKVRLYSRNQQDYTKRFAAVARSLEHLGHDAILDGEIVVLDDQGRSVFEWLQNYARSGGQLSYCVFDLLYLDGHDLRGLPLERRKDLLRDLLQPMPHVRYCDHVRDQGLAYFESAREQGIEGIMAKDGRSKYLAGRRAPCWLKFKIKLQQEAVIGGFTEARGNPRDLGALLLGAYEGKTLKCIGQVGTGFTEKSAGMLLAALEQLEQRKSPFAKPPHPDAPVHWVKPTLVCEVKFQNWTSDGVLRQPVFLGLRDDKPAKEVRLEPVTPSELQSQSPASPSLTPSLKAPHRTPSLPGRARPSPPSDVEQAAQVPVAVKRPPVTEVQARVDRRDHASVVVGGHMVKLTNLRKIYFPEDNYSKGDVIDYYSEVAPFILPYLKDRPQSLNRHPQGIHGKSFFQKDVRDHPDWIGTARIQSNHKETNFLLCQDEASLAYLANLGCIELNPWSSRVGTIDQPDFIIMDLDPQQAPFENLVEAALAVRRVIESAGIDGFCKTSGKSGLHIYIPLGARYSYDQAAQFAELIARLVHRVLPRTTSLARDPAKRRRLVYLDFLQNRRGQTVAAPYSVRPCLHATVSTPLRWQELKRDLDPTRFTIKTLAKRLEKVGDLWQGVLGPGVDILHCLDRLSVR